MPSYHLKSAIANGLAFLVCLAAPGNSVSAQTTQAAPSTQTSSSAPQTTEQQLVDLKARLATLEKTVADSTPTISAERTKKSAPFPGDWTWLNSNGRVVDSPMSTKYFTPEFRADVNYTWDHNHPADDSLGGSTETFRSDEFQLEQLSFGGDLRLDNVRGRFLTMFGEWATTTPRNDASYNRGQWDLSDAYKYVSEAWGGYHFDKMHGINVDAGIFVSYIGLFSYYNADNWAYQPSYVSSNTPWFFTGLRLQFFPTEKLKIEPWFINGWQTYARPNSKPGLGGQIMYRPKPWLDLVFNNYGVGEDDLGLPYRHRLHTDDSIEVKYYDNKKKYIDKAAFTFTADAGCEYGLDGSGPPNENVACHGNPKAPAAAGGGQSFKQDFLGWMAYDRTWWKKDKYALTLGGGMMTNPGRYLTLLPPINGATAFTGSPYFTENPGDQAHSWDMTVTYDYMPSQYITFRSESGYRHSDVPYWTGRGGITPPGGNNGSPSDYACSTGASSGVGWAPAGAGIVAAEAACGGPVGQTSAVWFPSLVKDQLVVTEAILVRF